MFEKITLSNGETVGFPTSENDVYKFYRCNTYNEAIDLHTTLTEIGNNSAVDDDSRGWFVRVKKQNFITMEKKTVKVALSGGFHNVAPISVRIPAEKMKNVDEQLHGVLDLLTPYQWKRVQKHFCGIEGCCCGGAYRNAVIEIGD